MTAPAPPTTGRRRRARVLPIAVALVLIGILVAITPDEDEIGRYYVDVAVGETGANRQYEAAVTDVRLTRALLRYEGAPPVTSEQVFVLVTVTGGSTEESASYNRIELSTQDGKTYKPLDGFSLAQPKATQPGFRTTGTFVFELPPERVPGAKLIIAPDASSFLYYWSVVRVDLDLDDDTRTRPGPVQLPETTVEVIR